MTTRMKTEQEALWYLGTLRLIQAIEEQAGRAVHLTAYVLPAGTHLSAHRHRDEEEGVYVTEGEATLACGEQVMSVTAGTLVVLPPQVHQHLEVGQAAPLRYLTWMTAPGLAHQVLHLGEPGQAQVLSPPPCASPERIQHLARLLSNATTPSLISEEEILSFVRISGLFLS